MAADSLMTRGNEPVVGAQKVFRTEQYLVGCAGDLASVAPFMGWLREAEQEHNTGDLYKAWDDLKSFREGVIAMLVHRSGSVWVCHEAPPVLIPRAYEAIGSGCDHALTAMYMGASAPESIRVARVFDVKTGGPVQLVRFENESSMPVRLRLASSAG